jgi:hypothetical protein
MIRHAQPEDRDAIWRILEPTIRAGETYPLPRDMDQAEAIAFWMGPDRETFVAEEDGRLLGTYYLRANQLGGGAHVANCGYMTGERRCWARGGAPDVRTFAATRQRPRLQGCAVQLRCEH